jgi:hypothetical protein
MTPDLEKTDLYGGHHLALRAGAGSSPAEDHRAGRLGFFIYIEQAPAKGRKGRGEDDWSQENAGGKHVRRVQRRQVRDSCKK